MTEAHKEDMVLVYELRRDRDHRERALAQVQEQCQAYQRGDLSSFRCATRTGLRWT